MRALVLADGDPPVRAALDEAWPGWSAGFAHVVAADGGARHAAALGLRIDRWTGDGDSLGEEGVEALRTAGVDIRRAPVEKDESDTELAVLAAIDAGATDLTILGALGGPRVDHALANVALLGLPELDGFAARLLTADARVTLLCASASGPPAAIELSGRVGDLVSLLPLGDPALGVTTRGLRYALDDEDLAAGRSRGLSNARAEPGALVTLRAGRLLIVECPATLWR